MPVKRRIPRNSAEYRKAEQKLLSQGELKRLEGEGSSESTISRKE